MCGACGGEARPVSGGRGSCASACCALRHGGSAIARLPSPPAASASMRFRFGLALRFRKPAALPRRLVASVRSARSSGRSTAPRNCNRKAFVQPWRGEILSLAARTNREELLRIEFSSQLGCRLASAADASETALSARSERLGRSATRPVTGTQAYPHPHVPPATDRLPKLGGAVCHNNGHSQQRQTRFRTTPFAKYWTLCVKWRHEKHVAKGNERIHRHKTQGVRPSGTGHADANPRRCVRDNGLRAQVREPPADRQQEVPRAQGPGKDLRRRGRRNQQGQT